MIYIVLLIKCQTIFRKLIKRFYFYIILVSLILFCINPIPMLNLMQIMFLILRIYISHII